MKSHNKNVFQPAERILKKINEFFSGRGQRQYAITPSPLPTGTGLPSTDSNPTASSNVIC